MLFNSTNHQCTSVTFHDAVIHGLAPDGGLWMMDEIPSMSDKWIKALPSLSLIEIAHAVAKQFVHDDIEDAALWDIVQASCTFPAPLNRLHNHTFVLELFHGPTLAFKDFGAQFLANVMGYFAQKEEKELRILVATSGDTGGAVAHAFRGVDGTHAFVLYPSGKVTPIQERQFTTLGGNVTALEVDGTFDDCQRLVKQALADQELNTALWLTSANSINVARLIPQSFYYFAAYAQLPDQSLPLTVSVPSGNFGNLTAGLIAKKMGLPIERFVAATNTNDIVPRYLQTGIFQPQPSIETISNAMDVGNPSNFTRMVDLYGNSVEKMREDIVGYHFSDEETRRMIQQTYTQHHYLPDPHTAVALLGLESLRKQNFYPMNAIALATAHPGKFADSVEEAIGEPIEIPSALAANMNREKQSVPLQNSFEALKEFLAIS